MRKKGDRRVGQCVYCGEEKELSRDHVPPKNLFKKPRPSDLITVESCICCNKGFENDDEYFRAIIATLEVSENHPEAKELWDTKIQPSYSKPHKVGFREMIHQSLKPVNVVTENGVIFDKRIAYDIDMNRFNNVIARIVKGLFWCEKGFRLSDDSEVKIEMQPDVRRANPSAITALLVEKARIIGNGVFEYRKLFFDEEQNGSGWLLTFYKSVHFICMTVPLNKIKKSTK